MRNTLKVALLFLLGAMSFWSKHALGQNFHDSRTHEIIVYNDGVAALEARLQMIERATQSIDVEYFLFDPHEDAPRIILQALIRKAREGVQVNILIDGMGILVKFDPSLVAELNRIPDQKLQIKFFNPSFILKQNRNHRKNLIVDAVEAITGGRNLEDKYFDMDSHYNFLDRDAWVKGPIAVKIKESFDHLWNDYTLSIPPKSGKILEEIKIPKLRLSSSSAVSHTGQWNHSERNFAIREHKRAKAARRVITETDEDRKIRREIKYWASLQQKRLGHFRGPVSYISDYFYRGIFNSIKKNRIIWDEINKAMEHVDSRLDIESPYMVLTRDSFDILRKLKSKDQDTVIQTVAMTNSPNSTDNALTSTTYFGLSDDLAREGALISVYDGKVPEHLKNTIPHRARSAKWGTHAKTMVMDNEDTAIGTFNLDPRSKNLNLENVLYFPYHSDLAQFVVKDINARKKQSYEFFVADENGKVHKKFSDCQDLDFTGCLLLRLQRPFGFMLKRLL